MEVPFDKDQSGFLDDSVMLFYMWLFHGFGDDSVMLFPVFGRSL